VASAQPTAPRSAAARIVDEQLALRTYYNLSLSRDGARLAYNATTAHGTSPALRSVFVVDRRSPAAPPRRVSAASDRPIDEKTPDFSPDGNSLAFLSTAERDKQFQLYITAADGSSTARKIGNFDGFVGGPRFSPDGRRVAVLSVARRTVDPAAPVLYDADDPPARIVIVDVDTGAQHFASPPDLHVYEYAWAPDGRSLAVTATKVDPLPDYFTARLYAVDSDTGTSRLVFAPPHQIGNPCFSPDGRQIAFIGGLTSDSGNLGGDLFVVPAGGGAVENLTPKREATIVFARWRPDSRSLVVDEIVDEDFALTSIPAGGGAGEVLFKAQAFLRGLALSADGETVAFVHSSFDDAPSLWSGPLRTPTRIEATRQPLVKTWGDVKSLHTPSDGHSIQSWLIAPPHVEPGRKYPLITQVHGGPAASFVASNLSEDSALTSEGYFLLRPNPRGSFGRGEEFQEANLHDFGGGDFRDIRASVRAAIASAPIDPDRVGISGWSYGGFMAMWAITQTNEFRAAVAGAGVSNWQSYHGQNDITGWVPLYFGATPYDDPAGYAKRSPITFVKQARTPTLMIVGENDTDCPPPQSRELWQALRTLGVPTQMAVYPNEAHGFAQPEHRRDRAERMLDWFSRYMPPR
jgi:dipeptidyl aminopeptidase/acylaminoacyl peptidase